jgi:hypothetical protein
MYASPSKAKTQAKKAPPKMSPKKQALNLTSGRSQDSAKMFAMGRDAFWPDAKPPGQGENPLGLLDYLDVEDPELERPGTSKDIGAVSRRNGRGALEPEPYRNGVCYFYPHEGMSLFGRQASVDPGYPVTFDLARGEEQQKAGELTTEQIAKAKALEDDPTAASGTQGIIAGRQVVNTRQARLEFSLTAHPDVLDLGNANEPAGLYRAGLSKMRRIEEVTRKQARMAQREAERNGGNLYASLVREGA